MEKQPAETTLYSLSDAPPQPANESDRRSGERHMTLYRVGSVMLDGQRELCLIRNISAGGMMIRLYCGTIIGTPLTIELKSGQPIHGKVSWLKDGYYGIEFDEPIDVIEILSASMDGPRPRMPRIETGCHATLREGANTLRVLTHDISQGGAKIQCEVAIPRGTDIVLSLPGLEPQPGVACWNNDGFTGVTFNRLLPLGQLVDWLKMQREAQSDRSPASKSA